MAAAGPRVRALLSRLKALREQRGLSAEAVEERLIVGPGWVERFESAESVPTLDVVLALLDGIGATPSDLVSGLEPGEVQADLSRHLDAVEDGPDLLLQFRYADHDAVYRLPKATMGEFTLVLKELRDGLARLTKVRDELSRAVKTDSVARTFLRAVSVWPHINPSDLWWFLVSRAFYDPFNHPAVFARLDFGQSWKRTSGWALEEVLVRHYRPFLQRNGLDVFIPTGDTKARLVAQLRCADRVEADKVDVMLTGDVNGEPRCFGVVHVKASFAERRTDDVPLSRSLIQAGYTSPLWTMDCKGGPSANPSNPGELGVALSRGADRRSAKRKDIEEDSYFSACFSYNLNTVPTPADQEAKARIYVCDFRNPDDGFSRFLLAEWERFRSSL